LLCRAVLSAAGGDVLGSVFPEVPWHASIKHGKMVSTDIYRTMNHVNRQLLPLLTIPGRQAIMRIDCSVEG